MNSISKSECAILELIGNELPLDERNALADDVACAFVEHRSEDRRIVQFGLPGYDRPPYRSQKPYSVEMSVKNYNKSEVYIIIFKDRNSRLLEMELIPLDESDIGELDLSAPSFHRPVYNNNALSEETSKQ